MATEKDLRSFLSAYMGSFYHGREGGHRVTKEDIDDLVDFALYDEIEQDIIDYGTEHPDAPFAALLVFIKPGLKDVTEEELLEDD